MNTYKKQVYPDELSLPIKYFLVKNYDFQNYFLYYHILEHKMSFFSVRFWKFWIFLKSWKRDCFTLF